MKLLVVINNINVVYPSVSPVDFVSATPSKPIYAILRNFF